ncbi:MAG: hypothetical protein KQJ78_10950 [Deltaproteobacteria bacterium]|nr:hypothetical protein [Deltaproteobacteria bacterium]
MAKFVSLVVVLAVALGSLGCLSAEERAAFYKAQIDYAAQQKPMIRMVAKEGEQITLAGVKEFEVYGPGNPMQQLHDEWAGVAKDGIGTVGAAGTSVLGLYFGGEAAVALVDAAGRHAGTYFQNSFNPSGTQASAGFNSGNGPLIFKPVGNNQYIGENIGDGRNNDYSDHSDRSTRTENPPAGGE